MRDMKILPYDGGYAWFILEDGATVSFGWEKTPKEAREAAEAASE